MGRILIHLLKAAVRNSNKGMEVKKDLVDDVSVLTLMYESETLTMLEGQIKSESSGDEFPRECMHVK